MKITFYANHGYWSQLNPNGGTATILHSVINLRKLGHEANVVARIDNFDWFKHPKPLRKIPKDTDVCIAVTVRDIKPMLRKTKAKPFYWARLLENHQMPKATLIKHASKVNVLVNSENLHDWFERRGIKSSIAYQGVDSGKWRDLRMHEEKSIGFLVSGKKRKNFDFAMKVIKKLGKGYRYYGYGVDLNGNIKRFVKDRFYSFVKKAQYSDLIRLYNLVGTWVSTSTKEGLHNCPIEAALCGCAVVYPDAPLAGCDDHCIDGKTAWRYNALDVDSAVNAIQMADKSRNEDHKDIIISKIQNRRECMVKLVNILKCT